MIKQSFENSPAATQTPMHTRLYQVMGLMLVVATVMFALGIYVTEVMNNVRAYVRGENLWAKAQNSAVTELYRYVYTSDPVHFENFNHSLTVNLGDRLAREALQSNPADREQARIGFLAGGNHPDDIPGMISFFLMFHDVYYLKKAIEYWSEADVLIEQLQALAKNLEVAIQQNQPQRVAVLLTQLDALDARLTEKELQFSDTLGDGARWIKLVLTWINSVSFLLLLLVAFLFSRKIARQLHRTELELRISDNRFTSLFQSDLVGMYEFHFDGRILDANDSFLQMLGYQKTNVSEHELNWQSLTPLRYAELDHKAIAELRETGACNAYDKKFLHIDGHKVPVFIGSVMLHGGTGLAFVIDQTEKHRMEQELRLSAIVMDHSQDGIVILDENQHVMSSNEAFCKLAVCTTEKLVGQVFSITHDQMEEEQRFAITRALKYKENWEGDIDFKTTQGDLAPVRLSISIVQDDQHDYGQYVLMFSDIKTRKAAEDRLKHMANFDTLTGIANRSLFQSRLHRAIARAQRHDKECAILFIDLNKFKPVNDHYGHEIGDGLLMQVAQRLKTLMREVDTVARIGGDEFVVVIEDIDDHDVIKDIAQRIIDSVGEHYVINGIDIAISCSVGISVYPHDGLNDIELTRSADIAMYAAKGSGEGRYFFFSDRREARKAGIASHSEIMKGTS